MKNKAREVIQAHPFLLALARLFKYRRNEVFLEHINRMDHTFFLPNDTFNLSRQATYYIIQQNWGDNGFFAIMHCCLLDLCIADSMGFIPYISIPDSLYNVKGGWNGMNNMYEYYFQPVVYDDIERIRKEENYFYSNLSIRKAITDNFTKETTYTFDDQLLRYMATVAKKYIKLRSDLKAEFESEISALLGEKKTLGVHYRGSDYSVGYKNHPMPLQVEQYFPLIDKALEDGFEQVFLATDDQNAKDQFFSRYNARLRIYENVVRTKASTGVHMLEYDNEAEKYMRGREVLRDMITLSTCDGLLSGNSHVTEFVRIWKYAGEQEFDYINILSNGLYSEYSKKARKHIKEIAKRKNLDIAGFNKKIH